MHTTWFFDRLYGISTTSTTTHSLFCKFDSKQIRMFEIVWLTQNKQTYICQGTKPTYFREQIYICQDTKPAYVSGQKQHISGNKTCIAVNLMIITILYLNAYKKNTGYTILNLTYPHRHVFFIVIQYWNHLYMPWSYATIMWIPAPANSAIIITLHRYCNTETILEHQGYFRKN